MSKTKTRLVRVSILVLALASSVLSTGRTNPQEPTLEQLEAKVQKQYEKIYDRFRIGPAKQVFPVDARDRLRRWQDDLSDSFAAAEVTIGQILKLHPTNEEHWRERRETMRLYSTPVSPPETRTVFGKTELDKVARLIESPAPDYPDEALKAKAKGEVRLRLVLADDGTVKYIFPMKPLKHGLTEAAMEAAQHIKFEPARRNGKPASQFYTLSYEFKDGKALPPYVPRYEFYF
jgi:TonB family protein